jgi:hypothetical protein
MTDCIGSGEHGAPMSNAKDLVLMSLHNTIVASETTNADHEPARRILIRLFEFIALALTDPDNCDNDGEGDRQPIPERMLQHLPNITTPNGILDVLALRSFAVLFMALNSSAYAFLTPTANGPHTHALPINSNVWDDVMCAWSLAHDLDRHILDTYEFIPVAGCNLDLETFEEAGNVSQV